ncbi:pilus assembly protein TadG-related protein [Catenulispora pinisilvae]|uniref:pilus assembly protein TadG-related protein n=1 Tax=Catenulispora pinisilvae TaxID=2705253 RepID=UPI001891B4E6|nr:pilus assembly protein TadG-related protein [Catenulispora pinisilvae]
MKVGIRRVTARRRAQGARSGRRLLAQLRNDRGSLTVAVVLWTPVVMLLTAFVVDTGFLISQRDRAADLADQAARRVADDLNLASLRQTPPSYVVNTDADGVHCLADARNYLAASGADPDTTVVSDCVVTSGAGNGNPANVTVTVTVRLKYRPLFVGMVMSGPVTVTGDGTAHPIVG